MHSTVVIKGSQAGMTVILDPDVPFEKLLEDIAKSRSRNKAILVDKKEEV